jgi:hypothetical protein
MQRRHFLAGTSALLLLPSTALARTPRPPKIVVELGGRLLHRNQAVDRDGVEMRFVLFESGMSRTPLWEETQKVKVQDGAWATTLGKRTTMGTPEDNAFPETPYLEVWLMKCGPEINELRLGPRLRINWSDTGSSACLDPGEGLDAGGVCGMNGDGAVTLEITALQRIPKAADWPPVE